MFRVHLSTTGVINIGHGCWLIGDELWGWGDRQAVKYEGELATHARNNERVSGKPVSYHDVQMSVSGTLFCEGHEGLWALQVAHKTTFFSFVLFFLTVCDVKEQSFLGPYRVTIQLVQNLLFTSRQQEVLHKLNGQPVCVFRLRPLRHKLHSWNLIYLYAQSTQEEGMLQVAICPDF